MSDIVDRADKGRRITQVVEAHVAVEFAVHALARAATLIEQAVGLGHDATASAHAALVQARICSAKISNVRSRLPWP